MVYLAIPTGQMILKYLGIGFLYLLGIATVIVGFVILNPGKDYKKYKVQTILAWIWFISGFLFIISISLYSRAVYNEMVGINLELFRLKQVNLYIDTIVLRINQLEKRRSQTKHLKNYLLYLNDPRIDSNTVANAKQNYSTAWKNWKKVHRAGTPNFHKKSYRESYQTNAHYSKDSTMDIFSSTGVRFIDLNHIQLPKLGRLRISGSHKRILANKNDIRLGTVTVSKDTADRYFASFPARKRYAVCREICQNRQTARR